MGEGKRDKLWVPCLGERERETESLSVHVCVSACARATDRACARERERERGNRKFSSSWNATIESLGRFQYKKGIEDEKKATTLDVTLFLLKDALSSFDCKGCSCLLAFLSLSSPPSPELNLLMKQLIDHDSFLSSSSSSSSMSSSMSSSVIPEKETWPFSRT